MVLQNHTKVPVILDNLCQLQATAFHLRGPKTKLIQRMLIDTLLNEMRLRQLDEKQIQLISFDDANLPIIEWDIENTEQLHAVLCLAKKDLENFHCISIPDEILLLAETYAKNYLSGTFLIDKIFSLLDRSAARCRREASSFLTKEILLTLVAEETNIPISYLIQPVFKWHDFLYQLKQKVFGQNTAIQMIGKHLLATSIPLEKKSTLANFLLVGPKSSGKKLLAYRLSEYLYGTQSAVLDVSADLTVTVAEKRLTLQEAVLQKPFAIFLLADIDETFSVYLDSLKKSLLNPIFQHAIFILTTALGTEEMKQEVTPVTDLMQLVLDDQTSTLQREQREAAFQTKTLPLLRSIFAEHLFYFHVIPFAPPETATLEKIAKIQLQQLATILEKTYQMELHIAPEVIKFLVKSIHRQETPAAFLKKTIEESVMPCIAETLLAKKDHAKQLLLSLNDSGLALQCQFVLMEPTL